MKHLVVCMCAVLLAGCTPKDAEQNAGVPEERPAAETAAVTVERAQAPAVTDAVKAPTVKMTTSMGVIVIELNPDKAPITVANFLAYVKSGHYNGTIFHRVIPNFMIQGGGFSPEMREKPTQAPIKNEASNGLKNLRGTIAMARLPNPDSATSQFFINHSGNAPLDYAGPGREGYAVFGKVLSGMDVVDKIAGVQTTQVGPHRNVPATPVVIETVEIINP